MKEHVRQDKNLLTEVALAVWLESWCIYLNVPGSERKFVFVFCV